MIELRMILALFMVTLLATNTDMRPFKQRYRISGTIELDLEPIDIPPGLGGTNAPGTVTAPSWPQNTCTGCAEGQTCQIFYRSCLLNKDCLVRNEACQFIPCDPMNICIGEISQTENSKRAADEESNSFSGVTYGTGFLDTYRASAANAIITATVDTPSTSVADTINPTAVNTLGTSEADTVNPTAVATLGTSEADTVNPESVATISTSVAHTINPTAVNILSTSESDNVNPEAVNTLSTSESDNVNPESVATLSTSESDNVNPEAVNTLSTPEADTINPTAAYTLSSSVPNNIQPASPENITASSTEWTSEVAADIVSSSVGCFDCPVGQACQIVYPEEPVPMEECLRLQQILTNIMCPFPRPAPIEMCAPIASSNVLQASHGIPSNELSQSSMLSEIWIQTSEVVILSDTSLYNIPSQGLDSTPIYNLPSQVVGSTHTYNLPSQEVDSTHTYNLPSQEVDSTHTYNLPSQEVDSSHIYNLPSQEADSSDSLLSQTSVAGPAGELSIEASPMVNNFDSQTEKRLSTISNLLSSQEVFDHSSHDSSLSNGFFFNTPHLNDIPSSETAYQQSALLSPSSTLSMSAYQTPSILGCPSCFDGQVCEKLYIPSPYSYDECLNFQKFESNIRCPFPDTEHFRCIQPLSSLPVSAYVLIPSHAETAVKPAKTMSSLPSSSQSGLTMDTQVVVTTAAKPDPCKGTCLPGQVCEKYYPPCEPPSESCLRAQLSNPALNCGWSRCNAFYVCVPGEAVEVTTPRAHEAFEVTTPRAPEAFEVTTSRQPEAFEVTTSRQPDEVRKSDSSTSSSSYGHSSSDLRGHSDHVTLSGSETNFETVSADLVAEGGNLATPLLLSRPLIRYLDTVSFFQTAIFYSHTQTFEILPQSDLTTSGLSSVTGGNPNPDLPSSQPSYPPSYLPSYQPSYLPSYLPSHLSSFLPTDLMASQDYSFDFNQSQTERTSQLASEIPAAQVGDSVLQFVATSSEISGAMVPTLLPLSNTNPSTESTTGQSTTNFPARFDNGKQTDLLSRYTESVSNSFFESYTAVTAGYTIDLDNISNLPIMNVSNTDLNTISPNEILNQVNESTLPPRQSESNDAIDAVTSRYTADTTLETYFITIPVVQSISDTEIHEYPASSETELNFDLASAQRTQDSYSEEPKTLVATIQPTQQELSFSYNAEQSVSSPAVTDERVDNANELSFSYGHQPVTQLSFASSTHVDLQPSSSGLFPSDDNTRNAAASETLALIFDHQEDTNSPLYTFDYSKAEFIEQKTTSLQPREIVSSYDSMGSETSISLILQSNSTSFSRISDHLSVLSNYSDHNDMVFSSNETKSSSLSINEPSDFSSSILLDATISDGDLTLMTNVQEIHPGSSSSTEGLSPNSDASLSSVIPSFQSIEPSGTILHEVSNADNESAI